MLECELVEALVLFGTEANAERVASYRVHVRLRLGRSSSWHGLSMGVNQANLRGVENS